MVILYGLCAVIWTIRAIAGAVYQEYNDSLFIFVLNVICAVIWIAVFVKWLTEYRKVSSLPGDEEE